MIKMNRIDACFEKLKSENKKALITFITAGDPDLETTEKLVYEMFDKGADLIELGVPFSDPLAEGVTIQKASLRALQAGTNLSKIFETVERIRKNTDKPLLLMMYINTIYVYGTEKFFSECAQYGIDGVIVPDMPYEERDEVLSYAEKHGVKVSQGEFTMDDAMHAIGKRTGIFLVLDAGLYSSITKHITDNKN